MKRKLFLLLAFILGGVTGVKADGLPTPVYTQDFESATTEKGSAGSNFGIVGATLTGDGAIVTGDVFFGQYYQNRPNAETSSYRTNYLSLSTDVFGNESFSTNKAVTISFWVNPYNAISKTLTSNFAPLIVAYGTGGSEAHGYPFGLHTATGFGAHSHLDDNFYDVHGDPHPDLFTGGTSFEKSWHHVVCVYSEVANSAGGKNTQIKQYLDGALIESVARAHNNGNVDTETSTVTEMQLLNQLKEIVIGGNAPVWNDPDNLFAYDEIAIYDVALTDDQVASLYNTKEIGTYYLSTIVNDTRKWLNKNESGYTYAYDQGLPFTLLRVKGSAYNLKFGEGDYLNDVGSNWQTKIVGSHNNDWILQAEEEGYKLLLGVNNNCQLFIANTSTGLIEITHSTDNGNIWEFLDPEKALKYAIEKAEEHVLGFEAGEYAPYNNTTALAALATAKAATTTDARISAYAALTGATWTANAEEVNAIYDGSFAHGYSHEGNVQPIGWNGGSGHDNATDVRYMWNVSANPGLAATTNSTALFTKYDAYYGKATGYTMPLNANTMYKLTFKYGTWGTGDDQTRADGYLKMEDGNGKQISVYPASSLALTTDQRGANESVDKWYNFTGYFTTEETGNYVLDLLKITTSQQNQYVYGDFNLVKATAEEVKTFLNAEIEIATETFDNADNVGSGVFQIPTTARTALGDAISAAQDVYDNGSATADDVLAAIDALKEAEEAYANTTLNAPEVGKRYCIVVATEGHAKEGMAVGIALGATSVNNPTGYTINTGNTTNQSVAFTQVSGNSYNISFETAAVTTYLTYGTENGSAASWKDSQIQATTDASNKGSFTIAATNKANVFNIYNIHTNSTIACQAGGNIYTEAGNADFTLVEATAANMAVNATAKWGTFCAPFAVAIPSGVTAYTCESATSGVLTLEEVATTIPANTPVILNAESGLVSTTFYGKKVANGSDDLIASGLLRGNVSNSAKDITYTGNEYLLQRKNDKTGFYKMNNENTYKVGYNRCYLVMDSNQGGNAREAFFFEDDATAISTLEAAEAETGALKDGKYLIDGKIVIVKNGVKYSANGQKLN